VITHCYSKLLGAKMLYLMVYDDDDYDSTTTTTTIIILSMENAGLQLAQNCLDHPGSGLLRGHCIDNFWAKITIFFLLWNTFLQLKFKVERTVWGIVALSDASYGYCHPYSPLIFISDEIIPQLVFLYFA
jgi:hypothetical protein